MSEPSESPKCDTCRFWTPAPELEGGELPGDCRRFPPVLTGKDPCAAKAEDWQQPLTMADDWCGEHQPRVPLPVVESPPELPEDLQARALRRELGARARKGIIRLTQKQDWSIRELLQLSAEDLLDVRDVGLTTVCEIREALARRDLKLRGD